MEEGNSCTLFLWKCWGLTAASGGQELHDQLHPEGTHPQKQGRVDTS